LRRDPGAEVEVVDGVRGELTVLADGREVGRKGESMPTADEVRGAIGAAS